MNENYRERLGDYSQLAGLVWGLIQKEAGDLSDYEGPELTVDGATYKLDWVGEGGGVTLYDDGVWQTHDGSKEGKVEPLHHKVWADRLVARGVDAGVAMFNVMFFWELTGRI